MSHTRHVRPRHDARLSCRFLSVLTFPRCHSASSPRNTGPSFVRRPCPRPRETMPLSSLTGRASGSPTRAAGCPRRMPAGARSVPPVRYSRRPLTGLTCLNGEARVSARTRRHRRGLASAGRLLAPEGSARQSRTRPVAAPMRPPCRLPPRPCRRGGGRGPGFPGPFTRSRAVSGRGWSSAGASGCACRRPCSIPACRGGPWP